MGQTLHTSRLGATPATAPRHGLDPWRQVPDGLRRSLRRGGRRRGPPSSGTSWIDARPVTNRAFATFVRETGWVTFAERPADPADYPGAAPEMRVEPSSLVFTPTDGSTPFNDMSRWWRYEPGADWRHPRGPGSSLDGLRDHPVVHVAWVDVQAYAAWAGLSLPTEAEWEYAARGGLDGAEYAWGEDLRGPGAGSWPSTWEGREPVREQFAPRSRRYTSPGSGPTPPNAYGLYDMIGNIWEWTSDWWGSPKPATSPCCAPHDPRGGPDARRATTPACSADPHPAEGAGRAAPTSARPSTAAAIAPRRATPSRSTPRPPTSASAV